MKSLLILVLAFALAAALFLTRPTKADFETYIREHTEVVGGKATGGPTLADAVRDKLRTFTAAQVNRSAADLYLDQCTYENRFLWTNVKKNGELVYVGVVTHWFERDAG